MGNRGNGVTIEATVSSVKLADQNQLIENYIGVRPDGVEAFFLLTTNPGNGFDGIRINSATGTSIQSSWIGHNLEFGIVITDFFPSLTSGEVHGIIVGNLIGVERDRHGALEKAQNGETLTLSPGGGVSVVNASNVSIGVADPAAPHNIISANRGPGVEITGILEPTCMKSFDDICAGQR